MLIYLSRHAESARRSQDPREGITSLGRSQAQALGKFLAKKNISALYSSDLPRALDTAEIVGRFSHLKPQIISELREISTSPEGWATYLARHHPDWDFKVGGGESLRTVAERARRAWERIIRENEGKNIGILAHGILIKALLFSLGFKEYLLRNDPIPNTATTILEYENGNLRLLTFAAPVLPFSLIWRVLFGNLLSRFLRRG